MDSGALLDLLGNENRRRILRLLARKPCYVTEISEYIGVSPKAVIDHLRQLEEAGLVESRVDDQRRKYFNIAENLRLEVQLSPFDFGAKSAYPASADLDLTRCQYVSVRIEERQADDDVGELASKLDELKDLERELSLAQRWVQGRLADVQAELADAIGEGPDRLYADVLAAVADGTRTAAGVADRLEAPEPLVEGVLETLADRGVLDAGADGAGGGSPEYRIPE
jgi:ArsR family transcriptional regulator